jgi:glycosyltransferase involved in cell wall biosynthesis
MLITVIVPTFNRAGQVQGAIESVLAQSHQELEVIVVDDGSTDDTAAILASLQQRDSRVISLSQPNAGVAAARNRGLERAQGDLIAFLDSDDRWTPGKLQVQLACLKRAPEAGMVWTDMVAVNSGGSVIPGFALNTLLPFRFGLDELFDRSIPLSELADTPPQWRDGALYVGDIYGKMILGNLVLPSSVLMTRNRLQRVGFFDEGLEVAGEDFDFFLRVCRAGVVAFCDAPTVLHQVGNADQLTHRSRTVYMARNYVRTLERFSTLDRDRVDVPAPMLRAARARGYAWAAQAYLEQGDRDSAKRHLRLALRLGSVRAAALAPLVALPNDFRTWLFEFLRVQAGRLRSVLGRVARHARDAPRPARRQPAGADRL